MTLRTPICDLFDLEVPVFLAGMGGVAYAEVCAAVSEAGGFGSLGMAGVSPEGIREQMRSVRRLTDRPFGVDLLAALPEQMVAAIDVVVEEGASAFIAGLGVPDAVIDTCHAHGVKVMSMCGKVSHAIRAERAGCDVVVAQGTEAGGHTGRIGGVALLPQTVDAVDIPVLAAGSFVDGRGLAAALAFGAQGVWMGTRFIDSHEARAAETYKKRIAEAGADETVVTRSYSGKPMRVLRNAWVDDWEARPEDIAPFPDQMLQSAADGVMALVEGPDAVVDPDRSCLPAGQGVGSILDVRSCREIVDEVVQEAREVIDALQKLS